MTGVNDKQVQVYNNVLDASAIEDLKNFLDVKDDYTDARPDFLSKSMPWADDASQAVWPQKHIQKFLDTILDDYSVDFVFFARTDIRYPLHTDTTLGSEAYNLYKLILFPLTVPLPYGTVFFDNHWYGPGSKFTRQKINWFEYQLPNIYGTTTYVSDLTEFREKILAGDQSWNDVFEINQEFLDMVDYLIASRQSTKRNLIVNDYSGISNLTDEPIPEELRSKYFDHIHSEDLKGLRFHSHVEWQVGSAIVWPRSMIHCTGNNIKGKSWILVHTYKPK